VSIQRKFRDGVAWMAAANWVEQAINFTVFVILARILGAQAFGLLALAGAFVILAEVLVRESLSEFLISGDDPTVGHHNAAFWSLIALGGLLASALYLAAPFLAAAYGQDAVSGLMQALSVTVLLVAPSAVPVAILRRSLQFKSLALRIVAGVIAGGVVGIWMALNGFGVWALVGQRVVFVLVNAIFAWIAVPWRPGFTARKQDFRDVLSFGTTVLGLRGAEIARVQLSTVIIGATLGPQILGLFSIAWRLVEIASFLIITPLRMVSQPAFAGLARAGGNPAGLLLDISRLSGLIAFPAFFGLSIFAAPVLDLMFGAKWQNAAPIMSIIAFVGVYLSVEMVNQSFCLAAGRARALTMIAWVEVALGGAMIWAVSGIGITAMSTAFVASFFVLWIVRLRIVAGIAGIALSSLLTIHLLPILGATVMTVVILATNALFADAPATALMLGGILLGLATFGLFSALFMRDRLALFWSFLAPSERL